MQLADVLSFSWPYLKRHSKLFLLVGTLVLFSAFLSIPTPFISRYIIDVVIPSKDYRTLALFSVLFVIILVIGRVAGYFHSLVIFSLTRKLTTSLRRDFLSSIFSSSFLEIQQHSTTYLMSRVQQDSEQIFGQFIDNVVASLQDGVIVLCGLGAIFYLNWKLSIITILVLPPYVYAARKYSGRTQTETKVYYEALALEKARMQEALSMVEIAKFYSGRMILNLYVSSALDALRSGAKMMKTRALSSSMVGFFSGFVPILILLYGAIEIMRGQMTLGSLIAFTNFSAYLFEPSKRLVNFYVNAYASVASVERLSEIFRMQKDSTPTDGVDFRKISHIQITDMSFSYGKDKAGIQVPEFELRRGIVTGIVGPSGAGKSTFIRTLTGIYDWQDGLLRIDSQSWDTSVLKSLRRSSAIVEQEPKILRGSLAFNLKLGDPTASTEKIMDTIAKVHLKEFLAAEPRGLSLDLLEGGKNLSTGQKQRIAIARAVLKNAELIIFDEPTAGLDADTEKVITDLMRQLGKNRFVIVISHKSATIDVCESVYTFTGSSLAKAK